MSLCNWPLTYYYMPSFKSLYMLLLAFPLFFADIGGYPTSPASQLNVFAHFFFFALLARLFLSLPSLARLSFVHGSGLILLLVLILGGAIEIIQPFFGRTASLTDVGITIIGAMAGLFFFTPGREKPGRVFYNFSRVLIIGVSALIFWGPMATLLDMHHASRQFPVLSDFETGLQVKRWSYGRIVRHISRSGSSSLRVKLDYSQTYPGTTLNYGFGNWSEYDALALSVFNPDPESLRIIISIRDLEHSKSGKGFGDRFDRSFQVEHGWNDLYIAMDDIRNSPAQRELDLDRLTSMVVFTMNLPESRVIYLDNLRLMRQEEPVGYLGNCDS
jgi:VanZ family protein